MGVDVVTDSIYMSRNDINQRDTVSVRKYTTEKVNRVYES